MLSPILHVTPLATLLDLPTSLSTPPHHRLRSTTPPPHPFPLTTPKASQNPDAAHTRLAPLIAAALASLPSDIPYHHPRITAPPEEEEPDLCANTAFLQRQGGELQLCSVEEAVEDVSDIFGVRVVNTLDEWVRLTLCYPAPARVFWIPPRAGFVLGSVVSERMEDALGDEGVDFLLMDPPWPNRSARRRGGYRTADRFAIVDLLKGLPVQRVLRTGGLVAVWVTNSPRVRGLLTEVVAAWGCEVVAEWVWVKITAGGELVVGLEPTAGVGVRRPYECLIFARRVGDATGVEIPGKVLIGVPDQHSRKVGVRELVEGILPGGYKAAELFGRGLTEGWVTWGDEAVKWNWEGYWVDEGEGDGL